jgi:hypothetical protein
VGNSHVGLREKDLRKIQDIVPLTRRTVLIYTSLGIDFKELCKVLTDWQKTRREKKTYVYSLNCLDENCKDRIWQNYMRKTFSKEKERLHTLKPLYLYQKE